MQKVGFLMMRLNLPSSYNYYREQKRRKSLPMFVILLKLLPTPNLSYYRYCRIIDNGRGSFQLRSLEQNFLRVCNVFGHSVIKLFFNFSIFGSFFYSFQHSIENPSTAWFECQLVLICILNN